ncbi:MAG: enolase [Thermoplasmatales archaeon]|jgi:enolase|nr:enolase [Candidatus Thermoplasmatota archaeon]MDA8055052.1 enolase [Thermoplasmatales archaeon]
MSEIVDSKIRKILDSRGNETVEVEVYTKYGFGVSAAPSGASKGTTEVADYPDGGIEQSIKLFRNEISKKIIGIESSDQEGFDRFLEDIDGTENFSAIGGNLAVSLSLANAFATADELGIPLFRYLGGLNVRMTTPLGNVVGGGKHAVNGTTIQEFLVASHADNVYDAIRTNSLVHKRIKERASKELDIPIGMGDEKAWVLPFDDEKVISLVKDVAEEVSEKTGLMIENGMDLAASNFYEKGHYVYRNKKLTPEEQVDFVEGIVKDRGYTVIEDPFDENDFDSFAELTKRVGDRAIIIGDDIYTTNYQRLQEGIEKRASNAILLKPNQVGTLSRLLRTWRLAKDHGMSVVVSHRSGETTDYFISHLAVAIGADYLKTGTVGGERLAKLNELVRIQEGMGGHE